MLPPGCGTEAGQCLAGLRFSYLFFVASAKYCTHEYGLQSMLWTVQNPPDVRSAYMAEEETELNILNGRFKYDARKWNGVSKSSFDFVSKLLLGD